jgi:hypothetical protein
VAGGGDEMFSVVRGRKGGDIAIVKANTRRFAFCAHAKEAKITQENTGIVGVGRTRKHRAQNKDFIITVTHNQSRMVCKTRNGNLIIAVCKRGSRSLGRRLQGRRDTQTRNEARLLLTRSKALDTQGAWGLQQEKWDLEQGGTEREKT